MKTLTLLLSLAVMTAIFAQSALASGAGIGTVAQVAELSYDELMKQGEAYLKPSGKGRDIRVDSAIQLFHQASRVAADDGKKLEALLRAGHAEEFNQQFQRAIESYSIALALPNISNEQKTRAQFARRNTKYQSAKRGAILASTAQDLLAGFEASLAAPDLPSPLRIKAREAIAELHANQRNFLDSALEYQKILGLPDLPTEARESFLSRALTELAKASPRKEALVMVNTLYAQYLSLLKWPMDRAKANIEWANTLERQGETQAAIRKLNEVADAANSPFTQKVFALRAISHIQINEKNYPAALFATDRMTELDPSPQVQFWKTEKRAAIFEAQKQEEKVRAEWQAFIVTPEIPAIHKGHAWNAIARSFDRERAATAQSPNTPQLIEGEKKAWKALWHTDGAAIPLRHDALVTLAQFEIDAKDFTAATALVLDGLKATEAWKEPENGTTQVKRSLYLILAEIAGAKKQYAKVIAALIGAQRHSSWGDEYPGQAAIIAYQDAMKAKDWSAARVILLALRNIWGAPPKSYFFSLAETEIAAQNWSAAKTVLDEFDKQVVTAEETTAAAKLRALIPSAP